MNDIKTIAQHNQFGRQRALNLLKGGNSANSEFYHSFGNFIKHNF